MLKINYDLCIKLGFNMCKKRKRKKKENYMVKDKL